MDLSSISPNLNSIFAFKPLPYILVLIKLKKLTIVVFFRYRRSSFKYGLVDKPGRQKKDCISDVARKGSEKKQPAHDILKISKYISNASLNKTFTIMSFFAFIGGYFLTSWFFFRYPHLIHEKKRVPFRCRHISHRGGAGENYENTMAAFKKCIAMGTDMLELDVHLTKDEMVVVSHDQNLFRCTGLDKNISELNYHEIPLLKETLPLDFDQDFMFSGSKAESERKFPLLEEVFETFPNVPINIDIKVNSDKLICEVSRLIKLYKREKYTVWGNFNNSITLKCYRENPNVNLLFSMTRVIHLVLLLYSGLLPFYPIKETHLEIFLPSVYLRTKPFAADNQFLYNALVKIMDALLLRPALFRHLKKRGIQTYVWVLNYEEEFRRAFDLGVDGVMTDFPSKLKKFLAENPQYSNNTFFS